MTDPTRGAAGDRILIVDDTPANLDVLFGVLHGAGYQVAAAASGTAALEAARARPPDLVVLDVMMPDPDGLEVCRRLKADPLTQDAPVIFLTALSDAAAAVAGFEAGGVDYVSKPFNERELLQRVDTHLRLRRALRQLQARNDELQAEIARREALTSERDQLADRLSLISQTEAQHWGVEGFIGGSETLKAILERIAVVRQSDTVSVLITGESGTGKELIARAVHFGSPRADGPFVPVNCSAVPAELADSLFFGHVRGAFTGADRERTGYFEMAAGGTLFLDEVGDMPAGLQAKLLRVLEERVVRPVGADRERAVDVRIVAATNVDLERAMEDGRFRQDLYFRLAGFPVLVPPLRERRDDVPLLARHFLRLFAREMGAHAPTITADAQAALQAYDFPGNIRELKNIIERALMESRGGDIDVAHLALGGRQQRPAPAAAATDVYADLPLNLEAAEKALIQRAMAQAGGSVGEAAKLLGVGRTTIYRRLAQLAGER